ncbi:unnamed protein product, partial [Heligmosomoides polygyrus]|uniref:YrdC-like domain-containing protein n=1 Tax=Heligmosomoides polygyrus TaxID=6339 RepID=A0A183F8H8_HELPZ
MKNSEEDRASPFARIAPIPIKLEGSVVEQFIVDLLNKVIDHETSANKLPSGLILTPTIFGYTISGASDKTAILTKNITSECSSLIIATPSLTAKDDYKENIKHLYELESLGINTDSDTDEASIVKFMDSYRKTITIESGRITAGFP